MKYKLKDTNGRTHKLRLIGDKWVSKTTIFEDNLFPYEGEMVHLVVPNLYKLTWPGSGDEPEPYPYVRRKKGFYSYATESYDSGNPTPYAVPYTQKDWDEIANDPDVKNKDFIESLLLSQSDKRGHDPLTGARNGDVL